MSTTTISVTKEGLVKVVNSAPWGNNELTPLEAEKFAHDLAEAAKKGREVSRPRRKFGEH